MKGGIRVTDNHKRPSLDANDMAYYGINRTASFCECTGLIPVPIHTESDADAYRSLYPIPTPNPHHSKNDDMNP